MNSKQPKISVIMCTYNRKDFLKRSIESILSQSLGEFELVLINNGSTDGSDEICRRYAEQDARIKLVAIDENQGASIGRNRGLDEASCEYVTIVDDDDYCETQMLEFLWELARLHNADISMCGSWNDFGNRLEPYFIFEEHLVLDKTEGLEELLKREKYNVAPPTKLFRKSLFEGIRFPSGVLVDDIHVIYKVFANANVIAAQGKPLYRFRKHEGNMTSFIQSNKLSPDLLREYLSMYEERTRYLSEKVPEIAERARYSGWSYMISMCDKIIEYKCTEAMGIYEYMLEILVKNYREFAGSQLLTVQDKTLIEKYIGVERITDNGKTEK